MKPLLTRRPPDLDGMPLSESAGFGLVALALQPARQGGHARLPAHAPDERRRRARRASEDDRLRGLLAFDATLGSHLGPRSPTSLLGLYYRLAGEIGGAAGAQIMPAGGMGAVVAAIARAAERPA